MAVGKAGTQSSNYSLLQGRNWLLGMLGEKITCCEFSRGKEYGKYLGSS